MTEPAMLTWEVYRASQGWGVRAWSGQKHGDVVAGEGFDSASEAEDFMISIAQLVIEVLRLTGIPGITTVLSTVRAPNPNGN